MRILIIGAGNTGCALAAKLCEMNHDIVVIDTSSEHLARLEAQLDIMTVHGSGSSPDVLEQAEMAKADLVIAVTSIDEVNILACQLANAVNVKHKVARVADTTWLRTKLLDFKTLGVDLLVSRNQQVADWIMSVLQNPGLLDAAELLNGRLQIAGVIVRDGSPLLGASVAELGKAEIGCDYRFVARMRHGELILPRGDTQFEVNDEVYASLKSLDLPRFLDWVYPGRQPLARTVVAGGSGLGLDLAIRLEAASMPAVLLERDAERAGKCSAALFQTLVLHGDASDRETQLDAGVGPSSAYVAMTGDDELNIISCILASKLGAYYTVAQVSKPDYVPIIRSLGLLDHVVNPHLCMVNAIMHFVRGQHVKAAVQLDRVPGEILHVSVRKRHRWVGKAVKTLKMPGACILAGLLRNNEVYIPTGNMIIESGDQIVVFALREDVERVQKAFRS